VFAIWLRVFKLRDYWVDILGISINLKHTLLGAQVNTAILTFRFALRALMDQNQFIFIQGLKRETLPLADARELRLVVLAERNIARAMRASTLHVGGSRNSVAVAPSIVSSSVPPAPAPAPVPVPVPVPVPTGEAT
jgi:hypothetical protein